LAVEVVAVGDRLGVLAPDVGEQAGEVGTGVAAALGAGQRGGERYGELLQPAPHPAAEGGRDLRAGEQLLLAALKAGLHRRPPSVGQCPLEGIDTKSLAPDQVTPDSRTNLLLFQVIGPSPREPAMMLGQIFERFVQGSPIRVMARALLEHALQPDDLDEPFQDSRVKQSTRERLFSALVDRMSLVVGNVRRKVGTASQAMLDPIGVSLGAVHEKLTGTEPPACRDLVRHAARQLEPVLNQLGGALPDLRPGDRVKILDGNHLAKTRKRLKELRTTRAGALPGRRWWCSTPRRCWSLMSSPARMVMPRSDP
jgi:hypothetical protein